MSTYTVSKETIELKLFIGYNLVNGEGFKTLELANEFVRLRAAAKKDDLVCIGMAKSKGLYIPQFNHYD